MYTFANSNGAHPEHIPRDALVWVDIQGTFFSNGNDNNGNSPRSMDVAGEIVSLSVTHM